MKNIQINFNAAHIVHLNASHQVGFGEASKGYHHGLQVLGTFPDFYQAVAYCKAIGDKIPTLECTCLILHDKKVKQRDGTMTFETKEVLMMPENLTVDQVKSIFSAVLNLKYKPGSWRFQWDIEHEAWFLQMDIKQPNQ